MYIHFQTDFQILLHSANSISKYLARATDTSSPEDVKKVFPQATANHRYPSEKPRMTVFKKLLSESQSSPFSPTFRVALSRLCSLSLSLSGKTVRSQDWQSQLPGHLRGWIALNNWNSSSPGEGWPSTTWKTERKAPQTPLFSFNIVRAQFAGYSR